MNGEKSQIIAADGTLKIPHNFDENFDSAKFIDFYRDKYRVCWKEVHIKLLAITERSLICRSCDSNFTIDELGGCRYHSMPKPVLVGDET